MQRLTCISTFYANVQFYTKFSRFFNTLILLEIFYTLSDYLFIVTRSEIISTFSFMIKVAILTISQNQYS